MRVGEVNGETYRFVSNEEMNELVKRDNIVASEYYPTHYGGCTIAFLEDDQLEEDANNFNPPNWFGEDVTFDGKYHNSKMSQA